MDNISKYVNVLGLLGVLTCILYVNPLGDHLHVVVYPARFAHDTYLKYTADPPPRESLPPEYADGCPAHKYKSVRLLSRSPDLLFIEGFLSDFEAEYLLNIAEEYYEESRVVGANVTNVLDTSPRDALKAFLPESHYKPYSAAKIVIGCVEERAMALQGHLPRENLESLQVVRYEDKQEFKPHFDWFEPGEDDENVTLNGNRLTSIFAYLLANCTGGTTGFPKVLRPVGRDWCDVLVCEDEEGYAMEHVEVRPIVGNAVFWWNLRNNGTGDEGTLHAGRPVISGVKAGLNIWTREKAWREPQPMDTDYESE